MRPLSAGPVGLEMQAYNSDERTAAGTGFVTMIPEDAAPIVNGTATFGNNRCWCIGATASIPSACLR